MKDQPTRLNSEGMTDHQYKERAKAVENRALSRQNIRYLQKPFYSGGGEYNKQ